MQLCWIDSSKLPCCEITHFNLTCVKNAAQLVAQTSARPDSETQAIPGSLLSQSSEALSYSMWICLPLLGFIWFTIFLNSASMFVICNFCAFCQVIFPRIENWDGNCTA